MIFVRDFKGKPGGGGPAVFLLEYLEGFEKLNSFRGNVKHRLVLLTMSDGFQKADNLCGLIHKQVFHIG